MKRGIIFLPVLFLVLINLAYADMPDISISEISKMSSILRGENGNYILEITNEGANAQKLQVVADPYAGLGSSYFKYIFIEPNYIELNAHESAVVNITIKLKDIVDPGQIYQSFITVKSITDTSLSEQYPLEIYMIKPEDFARVVLSLPETVVPGSEMKISISIKNNLNRALSNVQLYLTSELFEEKRDIQLFALQEQTEEFAYQTTQLTKPDEYPVNFRIYYKGEMVQAISDSFSILTTSDVQEQKEEIKGILVSTIKVTRTNRGNVAVTDAYAIGLSGFARMFTEFEPEPLLIDSAGNPVWKFTLNPEASYVIMAKTDYRPVFVVVILVILFAGFMVFWFTRGLSIRKKVFRIKQTPEGISEIKVLLHLKNLSRSPVTELMVIDTLPGIMHPSPKFGTLKPDEVHEGAHGIRMIWKIPELVKGEERILSYTVETRFKFTGEMPLGPAQLRFKTKQGKVTGIRSNRVVVRSVQ